MGYWRAQSSASHMVAAQSLLSIIVITGIKIQTKQSRKIKFNSQLYEGRVVFSRYLSLLSRGKLSLLAMILIREWPSPKSDSHKKDAIAGCSCFPRMTEQGVEPLREL